MKLQLLSVALISAMLFACNSGTNNKQTPDTSDSNEAKVEEKKISKRDFSVTASNSYSTMFLDSVALETYLTDEKVDDRIARRIRSFYNSRNYQFAWFSKDGLTEQALAFWNLHDYVTTYDRDTTLKDKALQTRMDNLVFDEDFKPNPSDKSFNKTELNLTQHFIRYMLNNYEKGYVKRKEMERFVPIKKQNALQLADSLLNKKHKDDKYFEDVNQPYKLLKGQLGKYYTVAKQGGWPVITTSKKTLKKGQSDAVVPTLKKRLQLSGDLSAADTSQLFDDQLEAGVKAFQSRMGYTQDGVITASLIKDMNVPAEERLQQILMNMERMRWMPEAEAGTQLIVVNLPEFVLHVYEGNKKAWDMNVVVGKEGHNTMIFRGDLNQVVFSPYWNVPPSIVKNEILPAMARNSGYLDAQNMEQVGTEGGLPVIRQKPGPKNSLGQVKFLFPNSFNIYFHDTPAKSLFEKDRRAYSHGCIRLAEPQKMADYLLQGESEWTPEKIKEAMNSGKEQTVKLDKSVPVLITYYTAWVDEQGKLNFRSDVYAHDKKLKEKMFL